ncbi:MAG TPA: hypothetical protein VLM38_09620 [Blastocatellia bacterium]|nr:hypothetical protein [Blastocatellia bacterium]
MKSNEGFNREWRMSDARAIPSDKDFTKRERQIISSHRTPEQVQRFIRTIPYNREQNGETCHSFRRSLRENHAHCLEGAIVAAVILEQHGYPPVMVSIESQDKLDHVLLIFKRNGRFGSVARSRDIGLHGRKPVFRTVRDLVLSYFEPYVDKTGRITGYGITNLHELGSYDWRFSMRNVWKVERHLQDIPHSQIRSSDERYEKLRRRYLAFHKENPDRSPDHFSSRPLWLL